MADDGAAQERGPEDRKAAPASARVADRPHKWTVWLALVGPIATLLAVGVGGLALFANLRSLETAQRALQLNETSMRVGQRAYLVVRNGKARLAVDPAPRRVPIHLDPPAGTASVFYEFEVHNLGRTPATMLLYKLSFAGMPGWTLYSTGFMHGQVQGNTGLVWHEEQVGQDTLTKINWEMWLWLDAEAVRRVRVKEVAQLFVVGELLYEDVFKERHTLRWCWFVGEHGSGDVSSGPECRLPPSDLRGY